jgi:hypothetical protein
MPSESVLWHSSMVVNRQIFFSSKAF